MYKTLENGDKNRLLKISVIGSFGYIGKAVFIPFTGNIFVSVGIATRERQLQIVFVSNIFGTNDILL